MSSDNSHKITRTDLALAFFLCVVIFIIGFTNLDNNCNWGDDFAAYMSDGIAMAQGRYAEQLELNVILRSGRLVGEESEHVHAWGFPLLHAITYKFSGFDTRDFSQLWLYKVSSLVLLSLMAGAYYFFLRRRLGGWISFLLCLAFCTDAEFFYSIRNLNTDVPFMALSLCSFFLVEKYLEQHEKKLSILWALVLGVLLWYSYSVRLNGIVTVISVLLAQILWLLSRKRKPLPCDFIPVSVFAALFVVFNRLVFPTPTSTSSAGDMTLSQFIDGSAYYWDQLVNWARHFVEICLDIPIKLAATFFYSVFDSETLCALLSRLENYAYNELYTALAVLILISALIGMLWRGSMRDPHIVFFIVVSFVGTAALSLEQELRYLYVLLPHLLMYAALGIRDILSLVTRKRSTAQASRLCSKVLCAMLCVFAVIPAVEDSIENITNDAQENLTAYSDAAIEVYNFIQDNTSPDETIAFFKPRALYLNTGRVSMLPEDNGFSVADADYYLHYIPMETSLIPQDQEQDFESIFENYEFILYQKIN